MILRAVLSLLLSLLALGLGLYTAYLASGNRSVGARLDETQRWCETFERQNALLQADVEREEFLLLHADPSEGAVEGPQGAGAP